MSLLVDIEKKLGNFSLKVSFEAGNEILALLGASGCGKSLTLKCIAGVEKPDRGKIIADDVTLYDSEKWISLSPQQRRTGLMFQNYALFPNMTLRQNILAGGNREKDKKKRGEMADAVMERFSLTELRDHLPSQLSGGQQQRAALARILVSAPKVLLLDEPFSALDAHLRFRLERETHQVMRDFGKTVVFVSHDRDEVFRLADRIAVMSEGAIDVIGSKKEVFSAPLTRNAAMLTGCKNITPVTVLSPNRVLAQDWGIELETADIPQGTAFAGIRMHDLCYGEGENGFRCDVTEVIENPFSFTIMLRPAGQKEAGTFGWETDKALWEKVRADQIPIRLPKEKLMLLRA